MIKEGTEKGRRGSRSGIDRRGHRVEHYEISGCTTVRNLAQQLRQSAMVTILSKSLAEEKNADQLLNQIARSLVSVAGMPSAIEHRFLEIEPAAE